MFISELYVSFTASNGVLLVSFRPKSTAVQKKKSFGNTTLLRGSSSRRRTRRTGGAVCASTLQGILSTCANMQTLEWWSSSPPVLGRQTVPSPKQTRTEPVASRAGRRPRGGPATARMEDSNSLGTSRGSVKITHSVG